MARIVLVGPEIEENLSLRYLSAHAQAAGHSVTILGFNHFHDLGPTANSIHAIDPDLVGLSLAFQCRAGDFLSLAEKLRLGGFAGHITTGGHFATFHHERILDTYPSIDSVSLFNAETTLTDIADSLDRAASPTGIPSLSLREPHTGKVVTNPPLESHKPEILTPGIWPDRAGRRSTHLGLATAPVIASQGCWGRCSFCCIHSFHAAQGQKAIMFRDTEDLAAEMAHLYTSHDVRIFVFQDDNCFTASERRNVARIDALCRALDDRGVDRKVISTAFKIRPESVTPAVLDALARLGLVRVFVGIENMSEAGLSALYRGLSVERNLETLRILEAHDVYPCFNVLLIHPWAQLSEIEENIRNLRRAPAHFPFNVCRTEVYHGTAIHQRLVEGSRLEGGWLNPNYEAADPRVEVFFRIMEAAFSHRSFAMRGSVNDAMTLGYDLAVASRHYPRLPGLSDLVATSRDEIASTNATTIDLLEQIHDLVAQAPLAKQDVEDFALELSMSVASLEQGELRRIDELRRTLLGRIENRHRQEHSRWISQFATCTAIPVITVALAGCSACKLPLPQGDDDGPAVHDDGPVDLLDVLKADKNTDGLDKTFLPWVGDFQGDSEFYRGAHMLYTYEGGAIPEDVVVKITTTPELLVSSVMSPDRTRIMVSAQPGAKQPKKATRSYVTVQLVRDGEQIEYHRTWFWVYEHSRFTHGRDKHDIDDDMRIMDPVPITTAAIDITPGKNVDIIYSETMIHGNTQSGLIVEDDRIRWEFDTVAGQWMIFNGLRLHAHANLEADQEVVSLDITATAGTIERNPTLPKSTAFTFQIPTDDDGNLVGGDHVIEAVFTITDKKGSQLEISGRATVTIAPDGDLILQNAKMPEQKPDPYIGTIKSLPRTLRLSLGVSTHASDHVVLAPRFSGTPEAAITWNTTAGTLDHASDGQVTWTLPTKPGTHRVTCMATDDQGGLSLAHHYETVV